MKKIFLLMMASCLLVMPVASQVQAQWFLFENPLLGNEVKDFSLPDTLGVTQTMSELKGDGPAVIFFWATWCPHCRRNLKLLSQQQDVMKEKGIQVILVDLGEGVSEVKAYLKRNNINFKTLLDQSGDVAGQYGVQGIPTFIFVDQPGIVKAVEHEMPSNYEEILFSD